VYENKMRGVSVRVRTCWWKGFWEGKGGLKGSPIKRILEGQKRRKVKSRGNIREDWGFEKNGGDKDRHSTHKNNKRK